MAERSFMVCGEDSLGALANSRVGGLDRTVWSTLLGDEGRHGAQIPTEFVDTESTLAVHRAREQVSGWDRHAKAQRAAGLYGICEGCGQGIPEERLRAMPTATKCMPCQEKADRSLGRECRGRVAVQMV